MIDKEKIRNYIILTLMKGLGPVTHNSMINAAGDINACFHFDEDCLFSLFDKIGIGKTRIQTFLTHRKDTFFQEAAGRIIQETLSSGINIVTRESSDYPSRFHGIDDMPVVLYQKGKLQINNFDCSVGIVGARRCSSEGKKNAIDIAYKEAKRNIAVISGMAKGVDAYAHTAAIKAEGYTIAVLGNGVDICYPKEHDRLYEKIAQTGCILSEYPPGTQPRQYLFPQRNRLIAALSDRLYVIDAGRNSGTRFTIASSIKYGRLVLRY